MAKIDWQTGGEELVSPVETTYPKRMLRHNISDEELIMLGDARNDFAYEAAIVGAGGILGTSASALPVLWAAITSGAAVEAGSELIHVAIFFASISVTAICGGISVRRRRRMGNLKDSIRSRTDLQDPRHAALRN